MMSGAAGERLRQALIGILLAVGLGLLSSVPRAEEPPDLEGKTGTLGHIIERSAPRTHKSAN